MYSGEYNVCEVTLSAYPHPASLKNMPGHGGNRTYDLWNTSPMLCQLSYAVRLVRVDIRLFSSLRAASFTWYGAARRLVVFMSADTPESFSKIII